MDPAGHAAAPGGVDEAAATPAPGEVAAEHPAGTPRLGTRVRRWNRAVHRDLGYLCAALTLVYAISGVAVNHRADWNPSYAITDATVELATVDLEAPASPDFARGVMDELGVSGAVRGTFRPDPESVRIFVDDGTIEVDLAARTAHVETVRPRFLLRAFNFLHLNEAKRLWTFMADLYAVALALVAGTGLFLVKGRKGIRGRGAWLTAAGALIPAVFLLLYL